MTIAQIRTDIVNQLATVADLGGDDDLIHEFAFETDDVTEAKRFWQTTRNGVTEINGIMLTRDARETQEPFASGAIREYAVIHRMRLIFRYGRQQDPRAEETFETILEAILELLKNNSTIFDRDGLTPQAFGIQAADATIANKKMFHTRIWEAEITFGVVEQSFLAPA